MSGAFMTLMCIAWMPPRPSGPWHDAQVSQEPAPPRPIIEPPNAEPPVRLMGPPRFHGPGGVLAFVRQAGCVQFDPVFEHVSYKGVPDVRIISFLGYPVMAMISLPTRLSGCQASRSPRPISPVTGPILSMMSPSRTAPRLLRANLSSKPGVCATAAPAPGITASISLLLTARK